jgi:small subunit ribosomal protein S15
MAKMATITKEKAAELTAQFGANEKDTGNVRVQIAILTEKIKNLTEHIKTNKKDFHSLRGLSMMVAKRKNLLKYYGEKDIIAQRALIKELGLRG